MVKHRKKGGDCALDPVQIKEVCKGEKRVDCLSTFQAYVDDPLENSAICKKTFGRRLAKLYAKFAGFPLDDTKTELLKTILTDPSYSKLFIVNTRNDKSKELPRIMKELHVDVKSDNVVTEGEAAFKELSELLAAPKKDKATIAAINEILNDNFKIRLIMAYLHETVYEYRYIKKIAETLASHPIDVDPEDEERKQKEAERLKREAELAEEMRKLLQDRPEQASLEANRAVELYVQTDKGIQTPLSTLPKSILEHIDNIAKEYEKVYTTLGTIKDNQEWKPKSNADEWLPKLVEMMKNIAIYKKAVQEYKEYQGLPRVVLRLKNSNNGSITAKEDKILNDGSCSRLEIKGEPASGSKDKYEQVESMSMVRVEGMGNYDLTISDMVTDSGSGKKVDDKKAFFNCKQFMNSTLYDDVDNTAFFNKMFATGSDAFIDNGKSENPKDITIFGYGFSGSGKTYSLFGDAYTPDESKNPQSGICFEFVRRLCANGDKVKLASVREMMASQHFDTQELAGASKANANRLVSSVVYDHGITMDIPTNVDDGIKELRKLMADVYYYRIYRLFTIKCTPNNHRSSRSHLVVEFEVVPSGNPDKQWSFSVVDMAGLENVAYVLQNIMERKESPYTLLNASTIASRLSLAQDMKPTDKPSPVNKNKTMDKQKSNESFINQKLSHDKLKVYAKNYKPDPGDPPKATMLEMIERVFNDNLNRTMTVEQQKYFEMKLRKYAKLNLNLNDSDYRFKLFNTFVEIYRFMMLKEGYIIEESLKEMHKFFMLRKEFLQKYDPKLPSIDGLNNDQLYAMLNAPFNTQNPLFMHYMRDELRKWQSSNDVQTNNPRIITTHNMVQALFDIPTEINFIYKPYTDIKVWRTNKQDIFRKIAQYVRYICLCHITNNKKGKDFVNDVLKDHFTKTAVYDREISYNKQSVALHVTRWEELRVKFFDAIQYILVNQAGKKTVTELLVESKLRVMNLNEAELAMAAEILPSIRDTLASNPNIYDAKLRNFYLLDKREWIGILDTPITEKDSKQLTEIKQAAETYERNVLIRIINGCTRAAGAKMMMLCTLNNDQDNVFETLKTLKYAQTISSLGDDSGAGQEITALLSPQDLYKKADPSKYTSILDAQKLRQKGGKKRRSKKH